MHPITRSLKCIGPSIDCLYYCCCQSRVACSDPASAPETGNAVAADEEALQQSAAGSLSAQEITGPVIVYSSRQEHLIKPLFDRFTEETGIEVQYQTGEDGPLIARLQAEGKQTFADVLYTVDAGNLWSAAEKGLLAPIQSAVLENNIPHICVIHKIAGLVCQFGHAP